MAMQTLDWSTRRVPQRAVFTEDVHCDLPTARDGGRRTTLLQRGGACVTQETPRSAREQAGIKPPLFACLWPSFYWMKAGYLVRNKSNRGRGVKQEGSGTVDPSGQDSVAAKFMSALKKRKEKKEGKKKSVVAKVSRWNLPILPVDRYNTLVRFSLPVNHFKLKMHSSVLDDLGQREETPFPTTPTYPTSQKTAEESMPWKLLSVCYMLIWKYGKVSGDHTGFSSQR